MRKNRRIFPLQDFHLFTRSVIALCPLAVLILIWHWLPSFVNLVPIAFHYPLILLAVWLGGSIPGVMAVFTSSIYIFFYARPDLFEQLTLDPVIRMRAFAFYASTFSFLLIVNLFEKALKKAQETIRHRDEFLSMISHELRTPLTVIKLNLVVLKDQLKDKDVIIERTLNSIERQINRQDKLINSMLDLAMLESGHLGIRKEECLLNEIIVKAVESAGQSLDFTDVQMQLTPLKMVCDKQRVEQVIFNLVHNAIKYGEKSTVFVTLDNDEKNAFIKIKNGGREISETDRLHIFKKFARPTHSSQVQGLGLGLFLSRYLVELHQGKLELTNSTKEGTIFTIVLPQF